MTDVKKCAQNKASVTELSNDTQCLTEVDSYELGSSPKIAGADDLEQTEHECALPRFAVPLPIVRD